MADEKNEVFAERTQKTFRSEVFEPFGLSKIHTILQETESYRQPFVNHVKALNRSAEMTNQHENLLHSRPGGDC